MSIGLLGLLDDVIGIAKVAAASLDDVAAQAGKAGVKAAGVVIDDAAVTPRYVSGFAAARELPIVAKIAKGSLRNKLLFLLPAALALSFFAPVAITPLLMLGGFYLCYEGAEKVIEALAPHKPAAPGTLVADAATDGPANLEAAKVASAVKTDFILSAEIMAITLGSLPPGSIWMQGVILALVGLGITALVYGGVALIVKADDAGLALASNPRPVSAPFWRSGVTSAGDAPTRGDALLAPLTQGVGRMLVRVMPAFLRVLGVVGVAAMVWVGGGIVAHGLEVFGAPWPARWTHEIAMAAAQALPDVAGLAEWLAGAACSGVFGLVVGAMLAPPVAIAARLWRRVRR